MRPADVRFLRCPVTYEPLVWRGDLRRGQLWNGRLISGWTSREWAVRRGDVVLYEEEQVGEIDRFMRKIYDNGAFLHDPAVAVALPLFQAAGSERGFRRAFVERMQLDRLEPRADGAPIRILEVSIGTGANLPYLLDALPSGLDIEWWGLDLSRSMMTHARRRARRMGLTVRTLLADAHQLPFVDHTFDRVFHVGGMNAFHDQGQALAEMGRVARPGTPIVVVDEQMDPDMKPGLYRKATFALVTFYDDDPRSPAHLLPDEAQQVRSEQISPFLYCLSFTMPGSVVGPP